MRGDRDGDRPPALPAVGLSLSMTKGNRRVSRSWRSNRTARSPLSGSLGRRRSIGGIMGSPRAEGRASLISSGSGDGALGGGSGVSLADALLVEDTADVEREETTQCLRATL